MSIRLKARSYLVCTEVVLDLEHRFYLYDQKRPQPLRKPSKKEFALFLLLMDRLRSLISPFKEKDVVYSEINPGSEELLAKTGHNGSFSMKGALTWKPSRLQWGLSIAALFIVLIFGFVIVAARNSSSVPVFSAELIPEG